jgi:hypothetical protein
MFKFLVYSFILAVAVHATILEDKVESIVGKQNFQTHRGLIELLIKDETKFIRNGKVAYLKLFEVLQQNGLLNLRLNQPADIKIEFKMVNKNIKAYKILNDTLQSLGIRFFFTNNMNLNAQNELLWNIVFKAEYMLDPVVFIKELQLNNCRVSDLVIKDPYNWYYEIEFDNSRLSKATKIEKNEKVRFQKPLRAFLLQVDDIKQLQIISRNLNNWYPHIVFFDKDLQVLGVIKKDREYKGIKTVAPEGTRYIKITDLYNLINIKRGLTVIVR